MKKIVALITLIALLSVLITGCGNYKAMDIVYTFDRAVIELVGGEVIEVEIDKWTDYGGERIQIITKDGTVYLTSSFRCDMIRDPE